MKKNARIVLIILLVAVNLAMVIAEFQKPHPFRGAMDSWRALFTWHHWRNHWHIVFFAARFVPLIALIIYAVIISARQKRKEKAQAKAEADWNRSLAALVDMEDTINDQDCLFNYLQPHERQKLLDQLRHMPRGSRSLRKAVELVDPDFLEEPPR